MENQKNKNGIFETWPAIIGEMTGYILPKSNYFIDKENKSNRTEDMKPVLNSILKNGIDYLIKSHENEENSEKREKTISKLGKTLKNAKKRGIDLSQYRNKMPCVPLNAYIGNVREGGVI